jgi:hypothetical protein
MRLLLHLLPAVRSAAILMIANSLLIAPVSAQSDQSTVAAVLGPRWEELSRRAGMIFVGTVITGASQSPRTDQGVASVEISLRVDRAIAGVEPGQVVIIHEWTGALSSHPTMHTGEHLLLFLYPPSRLGLTSPVGGAQGQLRLDSLGESIVDDASRIPHDPQTSRLNSPVAAVHRMRSHTITVAELERAIRAARGE